MVNGGVAIAHHTADTIQKTPFVIDRAGAVEADLLALVAADLQLHFVAGQGVRATADHVDQATRRRLAVQRGRRATQQGDALKVPGFHFRHGVSALWQRQTIEELGGFKATHLQPFGAAIAAVAAGNDAGHVTHGVIQILYGTVLHLFAGSDRD
ncbi:hypothetical protein D3C80_1448680 [compost metagenome]